MVNLPAPALPLYHYNTVLKVFGTLALDFISLIVSCLARGIVRLAKFYPAERRAGLGIPVRDIKWDARLHFDGRSCPNQFYPDNDGPDLQHEKSKIK